MRYENIIPSIHKLFAYYKSLAEKAIEQVSEEGLHNSCGDGNNSIALIIQHLSGNMKSRFTNFLTEDGEKPWRNRDAEFENQTLNRMQLIELWESGWRTLFTAIDELKPENLDTIIYIRNEGHTVLEALHRQLAHYSYHVGQIVLLARKEVGKNWVSLSIPKNQSEKYNTDKFAKEKALKHFRDEP